MELKLAAAVIVATAGVIVAAITATTTNNKQNYKNDYPRAAASAEDTIVSVTHILTSFQFSIS